MNISEVARRQGGKKGRKKKLSKGALEKRGLKDECDNISQVGGLLLGFVVPTRMLFGLAEEQRRGSEVCPASLESTLY